MGVSTQSAMLDSLYLPSSALWASERAMGGGASMFKDDSEIDAYLVEGGKFDSVREAVKHLNKTKCEHDFKVVFSGSKNRHYVLFRSGCQEKAFKQFRLPLNWDDDNYFELDNEMDESTIYGKAILLDTDRFTSIREAVRALNYPYDHKASEIYANIHEFCVVKDASRNKFVLLYSNDESAKVNAMGRFNIGRRSRCLINGIGACFGMALPAELSASRYDPLTLVRTHKGTLSEKYEICERLSSGAEGTTYLVKRSQTGEKFVAKEALKVSEATAKELSKEFEKMRNLRHPNCIKVVEFVQPAMTNKVYIISEFAKGGDLYSYMNTMRKSVGCVNENFYRRIFKQATLGLAHLHASGITHNDIKPENLLIMDEFTDGAETADVAPRVVVADYGCATSNVENRVAFGDPRYMSPEALVSFVKVCSEEKNTNVEQVGPKADVWSMGATIYQIMAEDSIPFLYEPCHLQDLRHVFEKLKEAILDMSIEVEFPARFNFSESTKLLRLMLTKCLNDRPTASEALANDWFEDGSESQFTHAKLEHVVFHAIRNRVRQILRNAVAAKLDYENVCDCHQIFKAFDPDNSGKIDRAEFKEAWTRMMGREGADEIFSMADIDGNGYLEFYEFVALCLNWTKLDSDKLGRHLELLCEEIVGGTDAEIDLATFHKVFEERFGKCEDLSGALEQMDRDGNGKISIDEVKWFVQGPELKRFDTPDYWGSVVSDISLRRVARAWRSKVSQRMQKELQGRWLGESTAKFPAGFRASITDTEVYWKSGKTSTLLNLTGRTFASGGYTAEIKDGRLYWGDGDIWVRES